MNLHLKDKVILVAGSSAGLGFGVAEAVAAEGGRLSLASRDQSKINAAADTLKEKYSIEASGFSCNMSDSMAIQAWVKASVELYGRIDGLVVNAGGPPPGKFDDFDDVAWDKAYQLTLMSAVRLIRAVLPVMRSQGSGTIVTMTSMSVKEPIDVLLLSNVFRSGVVSLMKSLSVDLAREGIRINNLVPGRMDTERSQASDRFAAEKKGISLQQQRQLEEAKIPLGRYGSTEDFGKAAAFLLSAASGYMTGSTMTVDGGKTQMTW